jgi:dGTP triphosphohydrolase
MTITTSTMACGPACSRSTTCSTCRSSPALGGGPPPLPGRGRGRLAPELIRDQIGRMVNDVLEETGAASPKPAWRAPTTCARRAKPLAGFSEPMAEEERQLKSFLYAKMYRSPPILEIQNEAKKVLAGLFAAYRADPACSPPWQERHATSMSAASATSSPA